MAQYTQRISSDTNDGYWAGSWDYNVYSDGIGKNYFGETVYSAFRFTSVNIPGDATITSATLKITASQNDSYSINFKIKGIDEDNTSDFSSDPGGRTKTTASSSAWSISGVTTNTEYTSPDLTSIIQEIITRGGWSSGNSIGFITEDNGTSNTNILRFYDSLNDSSKSAYLEINYSSGTTTSTTTTSTSTSTSSSSSSSTSTTTLPPIPEKWGLKVLSKDNKDNSISPNKLLSDSRYSSLKIYQQGNFNINVTKVSVEKTLTISFPGLNYRPFVLVYMQKAGHESPDSIVDTNYHLLDWSYYGATYFGYSFVEVYNDKIIIKYYDDLLNGAGPWSLSGYYYIFSEEVKS